MKKVRWMMSRERRLVFSNETTLKVISPNRLRLSKTLSYLTEIFGDALKNKSGIRQSTDTGVYFAYINLDDIKLDALLAEITPYSQEVRF
jgi:hypothetical protein